MIGKYKETFSGVLFLVLGAAYFGSAFSIKKYGDAAVDSTFFPKILGVCLILLSILQIINSIKHIRNKENSENPQKINLKVIVTLIGIVVYISLISTVGFLIMTAIYIFFQSIVLTPIEKRKYLLTGIISVLFSTAVYFIFVLGFSLTLPSGILG